MQRELSFPHGFFIAFQQELFFCTQILSLVFSVLARFSARVPDSSLLERQRNCTALCGTLQRSRGLGAGFQSAEGALGSSLWALSCHLHGQEEAVGFIPARIIPHLACWCAIQTKGICCKARLESSGLKMAFGYWLHQEPGCSVSCVGQTQRFPLRFVLHVPFSRWSAGFSQRFSASF